MTTKDSLEQRACFGSLLEWVNTFDALNRKCEGVGDLCSGHILLTCLHTVSPNVDEASEEPWTEILSTLEWFCGASLEKAVSVEKLLHGDQEHIARVVVLLLCLAVESKPNEAIISKFSFLDTRVQYDIKLFIENTRAQIESHALTVGTFNSGVGQSVFSNEPPVSCIREEDGDGVPRSTSDVSIIRQDSLESISFRTPHRPRKSSNPFYEGLDSPAGRKWLKSPAFSDHQTMARIPLASSVSVTSLQSQFMNDDNEVSILQHRLTVLNKKFESEKATAEYINSELQAQIKAYDDLKAAHSELEAKNSSREVTVQDLKEELEHRTMELDRMEKALNKYKLEVESLYTYKETARRLEERMKEFESLKVQLQTQTEKMCAMEVEQVERAAELKRLRLAHDNTLLKLQIRESQQDSLLQQKMEISEEKEELMQRYTCLEKHKFELESDLQQKSDEYQAVIFEKSGLVQNLESSLATTQARVDSLSTELEVKVQTASIDNEKYKEHVDTLQNSNDDLRNKLVETEGKFMNEVARTQQLSSEKASIENLVVKLQEDYKCLSSELVLVQEGLGDVDTKLVSKESQITKLAGEREVLLEKLESLESTITEFTRREVTLLKDVEDQKCKVESLETDCSSITIEKTSFVNQLAEMQLQNADLMAKISCTKQTIADLNMELSTKEHTLSSVQTDKMSLEERLEQLQKDTEKKVSELETMLADTRVLLEASKESVASLASDKATLEETLANLQASGEEAVTELQQELVSLNDKLSRNENIVSTTAAENSTLEEQLEKLQQNLAGRLEENKAYQTQITEYQEMIAAQELERKETLRSQTEACDVLEQELVSLKDELSQKESILLSTVTDKNTVEEQLSTVQEELAVQLQENEACHSKISLYLEKLSAQDIELEEAKKTQSTLDEAHAVHQQELEDELSEKDEVLSSTVDEKTILDEQLVKLQEELAVVREESEACHSKITEYEEKISMQEIKLEETVKSQSEAQAVLQQELVSLKDQLNQKEDALSSTTTDKCTLEGQLVKLQEDLADKLTENESCRSQITEHQEKISTQESKLEEAGKLQTGLEETQTVLHQELASLKEELAQKENILSATIAENSSLEEQLSSLQRDLSGRLEENESCQSKMADYQEQLRESREKVEATQQQMDTAMAEKESLQVQIKGLSEELQQNQRAHSSKLQYLNDYNKQFVARQEETLSQLSRENNSFLREQNQLYKELNELRQGKEEAVSLCKKYSVLLEQERSECNSLKEQIQELQADLDANDPTCTAVEKLQVELCQLQREFEESMDALAQEKRKCTYATSERKSVEAQLAYASQKLRDLENTKATTPPRASRRVSAQAKRYVPKEASIVEEDFYSTVHREFDRQENRQKYKIPTDLDLPSSEDDENFLEDSLMESTSKVSKRATLAAIPCLVDMSSLQSSRNKLFTVYEEGDEPKTADNKNRVGELQRRNKMTLPHLKSSYPVELQTKPESPSVSNETVKNGRSHRESSLSYSMSKPTSFTISLDDTDTSSFVARKRPRERDVTKDKTLSSPVASRRRISAPPTPQSVSSTTRFRKSIKTDLESRRNTLAPSHLNLRGFLDESKSKTGSSDIGATFEVGFSPPKAKRPLPKRLQVTKTKSKENSTTLSDDRRQTIVKSKRPTSRVAPGGRRPLKGKN